MTKVNNPPIKVESGIACFPFNKEIHSTVMVDCENAGLKLILGSIIPDSKVYDGSSDDQKLLDDAKAKEKVVNTSIEITYYASYSINDDSGSHAEATQKLFWDGTTPTQVINVIIDTTGEDTSKVTDLAGID